MQITRNDGAGRILGERFGVGQTTTKRTYFEDKQRVRSILTKAGGTTVQRLSYDYDDRLNLTRRTDALQGMTEYFEHDKLDRLKCADFDPAPGCAEWYSPPNDMNVWGMIAPFLPPGPPIDLDEDTRRAFDRTGELLIGAAEGTREIALNIARDTVLNAATFGGYGVYKLGEALWNGYKEDGVLGAANSVNPLFHFVIAGIDTTLAAIAPNRDYRALGAGGVKTLALGAAAVVAIAYGVGAVVESAGLRGWLRGAPGEPVRGISPLLTGMVTRRAFQNQVGHSGSSKEPNIKLRAMPRTGQMQRSVRPIRAGTPAGRSMRSIR